jgi:hypothetical protein
VRDTVSLINVSRWLVQSVFLFSLIKNENAVEFEALSVVCVSDCNALCFREPHILEEHICSVRCEDAL